jgi:small subunit ribosomal protein S17
MAERGRRKVRIGKVVSDKMDKSRVVAVERYIRHPLYKKYIRRTSKFMAHDENNESREGDIVRIMETRPLSKRKRWRIVEILERAK